MNPKLLIEVDLIERAKIGVTYVTGANALSLKLKLQKHGAKYLTVGLIEKLY